MKREFEIPMRDGITLFTSVYLPKDQSRTYPILLLRTPYSVRPYGADDYKTRIGPSSTLMRDKYIFVYQDVRGRWRSGGEYDNMRPNVPGNTADIDESSDTYDTIEWLLQNLTIHNGRVGQWGISYPGHYTIAGAVDAHPALKASSPQAPISDFFFDDFHHNGAYLQSYWLATSVFGYQKTAPTETAWYKMVQPTERSDYDFFMKMGSLKNASNYYKDDNFFWKQLSEHPNYDAFWQKRSILPHLKNIDHAIMTVGGWFDAEDLYGPLNIYKTVEKHNPNTYNTIVMGPWSHGDWARDREDQYVSYINFGKNLSADYQQQIEARFFDHFLKGAGDGKTGLPEAYMFDTGTKKWREFSQWPSATARTHRLYFGEGEQLSVNKATDPSAEFSYISDPAKPVPHTSEVRMRFTPRPYMADDQRFATQRPDVLTFVTEPLTDPLELSGEIVANLQVATSGTDADFIVKIIDVYPDTTSQDPNIPANIVLGGYQQMVRSEVMRARFRNSFSQPEPFVPNQKTKVSFSLQDVQHTVKPGHRLMVHIQSTWFPLIDRNPQKYVDNIFMADDEDFEKAKMTIFGDSYIEIGGDVEEPLHPEVVK